jgi:hypothetical protein
LDDRPLAVTFDIQVDAMVALEWCADDRIPKARKEFTNPFLKSVWRDCAKSTR